MKSKQPSSFKRFAILAKLMDSQFRIPGTDIRFGLDPLLGLIPGAGDLAGLGISACMLVFFAKNGASGFVLARMVFNIILDATIGSIPVAGDIFDVFFKANQRNLKLLEEHYTEGKHTGGAWKVVVPVMLVVLLITAGFMWLIYLLIHWLIN